MLSSQRMSVWTVPISRSWLTRSLFPPASGGGENLDRHWLVPDRAGVDRSATRCALAWHLEHLKNCRPALGVLAYPPEGATCAYLGPDGKLAARRAPLDIAVREPKNQDRRVGHAKSVPGPASERLHRFLRVDTLNVDDLDELPRDLRDQPEHVLPTKRLADRRNGPLSEVVLEVAVWEPDYKRSRGQGIPPSCREIPASRRRKPAPTNPSLHRPFARESASEEGHRQEPGQTGAGVALPESCCATERRPATRALEAANGGCCASWFARDTAEVQRPPSAPRRSVPRSWGEPPSVVASRESLGRLPPHTASYCCSRPSCSAKSTSRSSARASVWGSSRARRIVSLSGIVRAITLVSLSHASSSVAARSGSPVLPSRRASSKTSESGIGMPASCTRNVLPGPSREKTQPGGSASSTLAALYKDAGSTHRFAKASGPGRPCRRPFPSPGRRSGWPARHFSSWSGFMMGRLLRTRDVTELLDVVRRLTA